MKLTHVVYIISLFILNSCSNTAIISNHWAKHVNSIPEISSLSASLNYKPVNRFIRLIEIENNSPNKDSIVIVTKTGKTYKGIVSKSDYDGYFIKVENNREIYISNLEIKSIQFIKTPTLSNAQFSAIDPSNDSAIINKMLTEKVVKPIDNSSIENDAWDNTNSEFEISNSENAKSDNIIVVSPHMKNLFISKSDKINTDKINVIPNGFDHKEFQNITKKTNSEFNITYVGTANKDYDISGFIKALLKLKALEILFKWNIVGEFSDEIKKQIKESGPNSFVQFHGYLSHNEAIKHTIAADLLLLIIPNVKNNKLIYSGKLFEYIATTNPILCIGPHDGDAAELIKKNELGQNFFYNEEDKIHSYLINCLKKFKNNDLTIKGFNPNQFSRETLTGKLSKLLKVNI